MLPREQYRGEGVLSVTWAVGHEHTASPPYLAHRWAQQTDPRTPTTESSRWGRRCSLRRRARLPSLPASGLGKAGILPPPQLATRLRGPLPLVRSRFASLHPHRLLACGHSRFPSLGFELPAFTNRSALPPQGSGAALKWGQGGGGPKSTASRNKNGNSCAPRSLRTLYSNSAAPAAPGPP